MLPKENKHDQTEPFHNMLRPNYNVFCGDISGVTEKGDEPTNYGEVVTRMRRAETKVYQKLSPEKYTDATQLSTYIARQIEELAQATGTRFARRPMVCTEQLKDNHYPPLEHPAFLEMTGRIQTPDQKNPVVEVEVYLEEVYSGTRKKMWAHTFELKPEEL